MKRYGNLYPGIIAFVNLWKAAQRTFRGKRENLRVADFYFHLEFEILKLQQELNSNTYQPRSYRVFEIYEPKQRTICAADIRDRVVHHAICNVLDPIFENNLIADSFACRRGKGTHAALKRAQRFARKNRYFLKCDIARYFPSIDHRILKAMLRRKLKDPQLLKLLDIIIDHSIPGGLPGRGLPIGNLTSQYFANFYLGRLDHYVKHILHVRYYLRYMDDFILFDDNKERLHRLKAQIENFVREELNLQLKESITTLAPVQQGVPFLGFRIFPGIIRLQGVNWRRFRKKVRKKERDCQNGKIDATALIRSVASMVGHIIHANTHHARQKFFCTNLLSETY